MTTQLVLDALEQATWTRGLDGRPDLTGLVRHRDHGSQHTLLAHSKGLALAEIKPSVGAAGSSFDNALVETINGLYKTELITRRGPWRGVDHVDIATAKWVDWFNHRRLYEYCGGVPPGQMEAANYAQVEAQQPAGLSNPLDLWDMPVRFSLWPSA